MRLTAAETKIIKSVVEEVLPGSTAYLFGSRADDRKRGGDLDLLIIGDGKSDLGVILRLKVALKEQLGDQKIDVLYQQKNHLTPFAKIARMEGIRL